MHAMEIQGLSSHFPNPSSINSHIFFYGTSEFLNSQSRNGLSPRTRGHDDPIEVQRRKRRLELNRNSARRSRIRKLKQLEELHARVQHQEMINNALKKKNVQLLEHNHRILQENARLKEENCLYWKLVQDSNQFLEATVWPRMESLEWSAPLPTTRSSDGYIVINQ